MLQQIKKHLRFYKIYNEAIKSRAKEVTISHCKQDETIKVDDKLKLFISSIDELISSINDAEVSKVVEMYYINRSHDREVLLSVHMTQAKYYRIKNKILEKLLLICVCNGLASKDNIMQLEIFSTQGADKKKQCTCAISHK